MEQKAEVKLTFCDGILIRSWKRSTFGMAAMRAEKRILHWWRVRTARGTLIGMGSLFFMAGLLPLLSAFEAHVINVTAKIEAPMCDARSLGYWANNEGCSQGTGLSDWASEVQTLSAQYTSVFAAYTGEEMCAAVWMPNCSLAPGARRCRATAHVLAVELNVASGRLHRSAFLAGADDGDLAFYRLHLFESSTIQEALITLEAVLGNPLSSSIQLHDATHVAERIYTFYEEENPFRPRCVFDPDDIPACRPVKGDVTVINENTADVTTVVETTADTGGNSTSDGGGNIETGDALAETVIENEVNTNVTDTGCENCTPCGDICTDTELELEEETPTVIENQSGDVPVSKEPVENSSTGESPPPLADIAETQS